MPIWFLYPAFVVRHTDREKGMKPQGMTIVTACSAPTLASALCSFSTATKPANHPQSGRSAGDAQALVGVSHMMDGVAVLLH